MYLGQRYMEASSSMKAAIIRKAGDYVNDESEHRLVALRIMSTMVGCSSW